MSIMYLKKQVKAFIPSQHKVKVKPLFAHWSRL